METVPYIEKTHDYYRRLGYDKPYQYAVNGAPPFVPLRKPLSASRLVMVSSAGIDIIPHDGPAPVPFKGRNIGDNHKAEVFDIPSDIAKERLLYISGAHNRRESDMHDIDAYFPVTRLRELCDEGLIGSLAENHLRIRPCYSQRKTRELDAPEVLRKCQALGADVVLLVPV
jgi:hypothetical protein